MKKILFIDFEDSFTHNVIQEIKQRGAKVDILHWHNFSDVTHHDLLVLGPGPGHPDDYQVLYPLVKAWINAGKKIFGVCLGHQIFWRVRGAIVTRSEKPLHGQKVKLSLSPEWQTYLGCKEEIWVQRYNSLCVRGDTIAHRPDELWQIQADELIMSKSDQYLTYQFHPESVGTLCRPLFFNSVFQHLL